MNNFTILLVVRKADAQTRFVHEINVNVYSTTTTKIIKPNNLSALIDTNGK